MATALRPALQVTRGRTDRIAVETLPLDPVIVYTRKSSEDGNAQARSHDQQLDAIHAEYPAETVQRYFADDKSGKTFGDRRDFQAMLRWCEAHPQPRTRPGRIIMYDKSRFGRALIPGTDETDWIAYDEARLAFAKIGWELVFIRSQKTGNKVVDRIVDTLDDEQSSEYIRRLRANVIRGQEDAIKEGYWCRGVAPFPTMRVEARTGRVLADALRDDTGAVVRDGKQAVQPAERAQNGAKVVLAADPEKLPHWNQGARMLLAGESWRAVLQYYQQHVRTQRGGKTRWTRKGLKAVYRNEALIGILVRKVGGVTQRFKAKWEPLVDVDVFRQVQEEIARREALYEVNGRRVESDYLLTNVRCAQCEAKYTGGVRGGGGRVPKRYYVHPDLSEVRLTPEQQAKAEAAGCKHYSIPADYIECAVRDVIGAQRATPGFAEAMAALYREVASQLSDHEVLVRQCQDHLTTAKDDLENLLAALAKAKGAAQDLVLAKVNEQQDRVEAAENDLAAAEARLVASDTVLDRSLQRVSDTATILKYWDDATPAQRQLVVDWWVAEVTVTPVPRVTKHGGAVIDKLCRIWLHQFDADALEFLVPGVLRDGAPVGKDYFKSKNCPTPTRSTASGCRFFSSAHWRRASVGMVSGSYQRLPGGKVWDKVLPSAFDLVIPGVVR